MPACSTSKQRSGLLQVLTAQSHGSGMMLLDLAAAFKCQMALTATIEISFGCSTAACAHENFCTGGVYRLVQ